MLYFAIVIYLMFGYGYALTGAEDDWLSFVGVWVLFPVFLGMQVAGKVSK